MRPYANNFKARKRKKRERYREFEGVGSLKRDLYGQGHTKGKRTIGGPSVLTRDCDLTS